MTASEATSTAWPDTKLWPTRGTSPIGARRREPSCPAEPAPRGLDDPLEVHERHDERGDGEPLAPQDQRDGGHHHAGDQVAQLLQRPHDRVQPAGKLVDGAEHGQLRPAHLAGVGDEPQMTTTPTPMSPSSRSRRRSAGGTSGPFRWARRGEFTSVDVSAPLDAEHERRSPIRRQLMSRPLANANSDETHRDPRWKTAGVDRQPIGCAS